MRHRLAGRHLGRDTAHRRSLYRNLVTDLLRYERITTTEAKAKEIRPMAERIITLGKRGDLHARRQALRFVFDRSVVDKLFGDIAGRMSARPGGYLRITSVEARKGDGARMATIELVDLVESPQTTRPQRVTAPPVAAAPQAPSTEPTEAAPAQTTDESQPGAVAEHEGSVAEADAPEVEAQVEESAEAAAAEDDAVETTEDDEQKDA
jgi:large subunit ribosomal protein L17